MAEAADVALMSHLSGRLVRPERRARRWVESAHAAPQREVVLVQVEPAGTLAGIHVFNRIYVRRRYIKTLAVY